MKEKIGVIALVLLGIFAVFMFLIGIPLLQNMNKPINPPADPFLHETAGDAPISDECRQKQYAAAKQLEPLQKAQNAVRDRQNQIVYEGVGALPVGDHTTQPYIMPDYRAEYDQLHAKYLDLSDQIETIQLKYACN